MPGAILESRSANGWQRTNSANYSTNGYPSRIPTVTRPDLSTGLNATGDGVIPWGFSSGVQGNYGPYGLMLLPYGVGADDNTFNLRVLGWRVTQLNVGTPLWIPNVILEVQATLSAVTGIANADLGTTTLFADNITIVSTGPTLQNAAAPNTVPPIVPDLALFPGAADSLGFLILRSFGFSFLEVIFTTGGVATSCNALWAVL